MWKLQPAAGDSSDGAQGPGGRRGGHHLLPVSMSVATMLPFLETEYAVASSAVSATAVTLCLRLTGSQPAGYLSATALRRSAPRHTRLVQMGRCCRRHRPLCGTEHVKADRAGDWG